MLPRRLDTSIITLPSPPVSPDGSEAATITNNHNSQCQKRKRSGSALVRDRKHARFDHTLLEQYLKNGGSPNVCDQRKGRSLLIWACTGQSEEALKILLSRSEVDPNAAYGQERSTALHVAATVGFKIGLEILLQQPTIDVNATDFLDQAPIHKAVITNQPGCLESLILHNARVDIQDENRRLPLHLAVFHRRLECTKILLRYLKSVNTLWTARTLEGRSVLEEAVMGGYAPILQLLLDEIKDTPIPADHKRSLLKLAVQWNRIECLQLLIKAGFDVNTPLSDDHIPETAISLSVQQRKIDLVRLLRSYGASPCLSNGNNPSLLYAANHGFVDMIPLLVTSSTSNECIRQTISLSESIGLHRQVCSAIVNSRISIKQNLPPSP